MYIFRNATRDVTSLTKLALFVAAVALTQAPGHALAQAPAKSAAKSAADEKLDVSDLEKKYWAAKDTDFSVVQNRLFSKAGKFSLTGNYGIMLNDPWSEGPTYSGSLAYYFSERYGVELHYSDTQSRDNKAAQRLKLDNGAYANHNKMKQFYGASFVFVPFYAKMSFMNQSISYFDMSVSLGAGMTEYEQQREEGNLREMAPTLTLDFSQHFFIHQALALRLDLKNRFYNNDIAWYRPTLAGVPHDPRIETTELNYIGLLMLGFSLYY
jgi:outer membrane beta-barrel protein